MSAAAAREATGAAAEKALPDATAILEARKKVIGFNVAVNYSKLPLYIVKGKGQFLYDEKGEEYLDCVNNVCHVGHCHPDVVAAGVEQLAELNTNSRYLSPYIVEYARRLTATLPPKLSVVFWVNSGSEANDLALRLARAHTKKRGVITVGGAYHGHLTSIIDISPYKYRKEGGTGLRKWVREAPIPDVFSGMHRGRIEDDALGAAYAGEVDKCIASLGRSEGREKARRDAALARKAARAAGGAVVTGAGATGTAASPASSVTSPAADTPCCDGHDSDSDLDDDGLTAGCGAFIMESLLSCGGQVLPPTGYLRRVYSAVRAAGGVCIADEVQVGFGRVGSHMWAFQLQGDDVVPDIVTMGKPLGNGYPVAMVVTTPEVARSFDNGMEYFNTFGGNPVAGRVALATLDVLEREKMQENAAKVGAVLLEGFHALAAKHGYIGSVRGVGLMVGLEIIKPVTAATAATDGGAAAGGAALADRVSWTEAASAIVYAMRKRRILLSTDGMDSNVIKLKPPMCFSEADAKHMLANLEEVMADVDAAIAAYRAL